MTPAAAAQAGFDATAKLDFEEMAKFMAPAVVAKFKQALVQAEKAKLPVNQVLPTFEAGEAFWSAEHSAWFVKCKMIQPVRKHNLALRKDNPAKRWQVDGGI